MSVSVLNQDGGAGGWQRGGRLTRWTPHVCRIGKGGARQRPYSTPPRGALTRAFAGSREQRAGWQLPAGQRVPLPGREDLGGSGRGWGGAVSSGPTRPPGRGTSRHSGLLKPSWGRLRDRPDTFSVCLVKGASVHSWYRCECIRRGTKWCKCRCITSRTACSILASAT